MPTSNISFTEISHIWGVTKQRVHQVISQAQREGIVTIVKNPFLSSNEISRTDYRKLMTWRKKIRKKVRGPAKD